MFLWRGPIAVLIFFCVVHASLVKGHWFDHKFRGKVLGDLWLKKSFFHSEKKRKNKTKKDHIQYTVPTKEEAKGKVKNDWFGQPHVHVSNYSATTLNLNSSRSFKSSGESLIKIYQEILTVNIIVSITYIYILQLSCHMISACTYCEVWEWTRS